MDHDRLEPISDEATLLTKVARRRREIVIRRRLLQGLAGALSLALVGFGAATVLGTGADERPVSGLVDEDRASDPTPTPSPEPESSPGGTPSPRPAPAQAGEPCRNSFDPVCGPFYWDPEPELDEPMHITIEFSPERPTVGEEVTFTVTVTDDATTDPQVIEGEWGEGGFWAGPMCPEVPERYGPWTPPERRQRTKVETYRHTFENSGTYEVTFKASTNGCNFKGYDPYASEATESIRITVRDPSPNPLPL